MFHTAQRSQGARARSRLDRITRSGQPKYIFVRNPADFPMLLNPSYAVPSSEPFGHEERNRAVLAMSLAGVADTQNPGQMRVLVKAHQSNSDWI